MTILSIILVLDHYPIYIIHDVLDHYPIYIIYLILSQMTILSIILVLDHYPIYIILVLDHYPIYLILSQMTILSIILVLDQYPMYIILVLRSVSYLYYPCPRSVSYVFYPCPQISIPYILSLSQIIILSCLFISSYGAPAYPKEIPSIPGINYDKPSPAPLQLAPAPGYIPAPAPGYAPAAPAYKEPGRMILFKTIARLA